MASKKLGIIRVLAQLRVERSKHGESLKPLYVAVFCLQGHPRPALTETAERIRYGGYKRLRVGSLDSYYLLKSPREASLVCVGVLLEGKRLGLVREERYVDCPRRR